MDKLDMKYSGYGWSTNAGCARASRGDPTPGRYPVPTLLRAYSQYFGRQVTPTPHILLSGL